MNNISIIVAVGKANEIGNENQLLWHISEDLKYFKRVTSGKTIVMGGNTWLSLPRRPLPKRRNIVLSRDVNKQYEGAEVMHSVEEVSKAVINEEEVFIMGGAMVYQHFLPIASKLYITHVLENFVADTWFPKIDNQIWRQAEKSELFLDEETGLQCFFAEYVRK